MKKITYIIILLLISGCATYRPIVDMRGVDRNRYEVDLRECQAYAEQVSPGTSAVVGAGAGAAIGAIIGLTVGVIFNVDPGDIAGAGAAIGGIHGAASGGASAGASQMDIIRRCMAGRGYHVLR